MIRLLLLIAGTNLNTSALALNTTVAALQVAQGSATSGQNGDLSSQAPLHTAAPTYSTMGRLSPLSLTIAGSLRVSCLRTAAGSSWTCLS